MEPTNTAPVVDMLIQQLVETTCNTVSEMIHEQVINTSITNRQELEVLFADHLQMCFAYMIDPEYDDPDDPSVQLPPSFRANAEIQGKRIR